MGYSPRGRKESDMTEQHHFHFLSTPVLLPGKSHGQRALIGHSPWGRKESDTTERLYLLTFSLSLCLVIPCIVEDQSRVFIK